MGKTPFLLFPIPDMVLEDTNTPVSYTHLGKIIYGAIKINEKEISMNKKKMYPRYFVIATVAVYLIFYIIPSILGLVYSFTDKTIYSGNTIHFVGIKNYLQLIKQNRFVTGMKNTFSFTIITTVFKNVLGFGLAIDVYKRQPFRYYGGINRYFVS